MEIIMITIEELMRQAEEVRASDVHITAGVPPKYRVAGKLINMDYPKLVPADTEAILSPIMNERQREVLADKGEVDFSFSIDGMGRYRVNVFKQRGSVAAVLRLITSKIPSVQELELPPSVVELYKKKRGLILVTGPTGSGKSTTLAAIIDKINENNTSHVITLEDPIEYLHQHKKSTVNQREIGNDTMSYAAALRAALREDPDVILVGEMRDLETISTAITAAETGHLVLSTLHTIGAAATIDRVIDVFPPHQQEQIRVQLAMVLECVVSQQLVPTIRGNKRVAAFEVLHMNSAVKNLIRENKSFQISSMMQMNKKLGMQTMDDALYDLYRMGVITSESALEFSQDYAALKKKLLM